MSSDSPVISVRDLSKCYEIFETPGDRLKELVLQPLRSFLSGTHQGEAPKSPSFHREFWALDGISFEVWPGETLGIIGRNGSGKSTLLQILAGTLAASFGEVEVRGRVAALLELGSGFNPEFTGRENVYLNGQILGLSRGQVEERFEAISEFADIGEFMDQPVKTYSSGMFVRLAFAVHAHIDASIVIIDEALAVGDIFFRQKCYERLEALRRQGAAIILVSHSMPDIEQYCERAIVLNQGSVHFSGSASEAARHYYLLHQPTIEKSGVDFAVLNSQPLGPSELEASGELLPPVSPRPLPDGKTQIGNGGARCLSITLCNSEGLETQNFRQGERVTFYYSFELAAPLEVPIVGIVIKNERGVIIHGKNSWQFGSDSPVRCVPGDRIRCRHDIDLTIGPGEYLFEVGLSSIPRDLWANRDHVSHDEMSAAEARVCHVSDAGMFTVGLKLDQQIAKLTHHGITDLSGALSLQLDSSADAMKFERSVQAASNITSYSGSL
jgi:lipopolysaccharide transport system ATP-binding protein